MIAREQMPPQIFVPVSLPLQYQVTRALAGEVVSEKPLKRGNNLALSSGN